MTQRFAFGAPKRILSLLVAVLMVISAFLPLGVMALGESSYSIYVTAVMGDDTRGYIAQPVDGMPNTYWVAMDGQAFDAELILDISGGSGYSFSPESGAQLTGMLGDSGNAFSSPFMIYVFDEAGQQIDQIMLYASSMPMPQQEVEPPVEPEPSVPDPVWITVRYMQDNGTELGQESFELKAGDSVKVKPTINLSAEYELIGEASQKVSMDMDGNVSPSTEIVFTYKYNEPAPKTPDPVWITVRYVQDNGTELGQESFELKAGDSVKVKPTINLSAEFELIGEASQKVSMDMDGNVSPSTEIVFTYKYNEPVVVTPMPAWVTVHYVQSDNQNIETKGFEIEAGQSVVVTPSVNLGSEYELMAPYSYEVSMDMQGNVSPSNELTFTYTYHEPAPKDKQKGKVTVKHVDDATGDVLRSTEYDVVESADALYISPDDDILADYDIIGDQFFSITIDAQGKISPADTVSFVCHKREQAPEPAPQKQDISKTITVTFTDASNKEVAKAQNVTFTEAGEHAITAIQINGYKLTDLDTKYVEVFENGSADRETVDFKYEQAAPEGVDVAVYHKDGAGKDLIKAYNVTCATGETTPISAQEISGYALEIGQEATRKVTVSADGVADKDSILFVFEEIPKDTPVDQGDPINRYGTTTTTGVFIRKTPNEKGNMVTQIKNTGTAIFMHVTEPNESGVNWTKVYYEGQEGYVRSDLLEMMTKFDSDRYQATQKETPPLYEPAPTKVPDPTATPTAAPTKSTMYEGYALTTAKTALRVEMSTEDSAIMTTLAKQTLVKCVYQVTNDGISWCSVTTLDNVKGFVDEAVLKRISDADAKPYLDDYAKSITPAQTATPKPTATPASVSGYAVTIGDNVPMRSSAYANGALVNVLAAKEYVYVYTQEHVDGVSWHQVRYGDQVGYIRIDQLRMLSAKEEADYLNSLSQPVPQPTYSPLPYNSNSPSSYGYVTSSGTNFRTSASTKSGKIKALNKYAFGLVLGKTVVDKVTWYNVKIGDTTGYVHGDYFKVLSVSELETFLTSDNYINGNSNTSSGGSTSGGSSGSSGGSSGASSGSLVSQEDINIGVWENPNASMTASYAPFDPFATLAPIGGEEDTDAEASAEPSLIPTFDPAASTDVPEFDTEETKSSGALGVVLTLIGLTAVGGGGAYAYSIYRSNQKKAAQRAAQRRAQQQQAQRQTTPGGRPYARPAQPGAPAQTGAPTAQQRSPQPGVTSPIAQRPTTAQGSTAARNTTAGVAGVMGTAAQDAYRRPQQGQPEQAQGEEMQQSTEQAAVRRPNPYAQGQGQGNVTRDGSAYQPPVQRKPIPPTQNTTDFPTGTRSQLQRQPRTARRPETHDEE